MHNQNPHCCCCYGCCYCSAAAACPVAGWCWRACCCWTKKFGPRSSVHHLGPPAHWPERELAACYSPALLKRLQSAARSSEGEARRGGEKSGSAHLVHALYERVVATKNKGISALHILSCRLICKRDAKSKDPDRTMSIFSAISHILQSYHASQLIVSVSYIRQTCAPYEFAPLTA